ncbi:MAG TPA: FtsQ-type POTRA domain-containing protein [Proteobacteria bacterium]|nr:FtsQ-type POTRA domain-containing protein [Pseudomonadota bacterium]
MRLARPPLPAGHKRRLLLLIALFCFCGLGCGALFLWWPTIKTAAESWCKSREAFLVREIVVSGNLRSSRQEIVKALALAPRQLIFTFGLQGLRERVQALPFIDAVRIRRRWPDRLEIKVTEKQPLLLLYLDELYLVDDQGALIAPAPQAEVLDFPVISGISPQEWRKRPQVWRRLLQKSAELQSAWENEGRDWPEQIAQIVVDEVCGLTVYTTGRAWELQLGMENFTHGLRRWRQVLDVLGDQAAAVKYFDCAGYDSVVAGLRISLDNGGKKAERDGQK